MSAADRAHAAVKHLGMLFGKSETLRTSSWRLVEKLELGRATKTQLLVQLAEARDLWQRIYEAAQQLMPGTVEAPPLAPAVTETSEPATADDDEAEVDW